MYYRFGKVFHFISVLLFLFTFLYFYSAMPDVVAYELDENGYNSKEISKSTFFYIGIILFAVLNLVMVTVSKLIENKSTKTFRQLFPSGDIFRDYMLTWTYSFTAIINISLAILTLFIHTINNQNEISSGSYSLFFYLIPILFVVWIIALFWILLQKFNSIRSNSTI
ncbi:DNA topoisomerase IV [Aquiflexum sp. TKW24L]|uniref:DNA topoisomerase IV n=1 Tax=Aquiflexum sp. TKW24L TaxID=2942212 RepID=UPI0020BE6534|nr:DNA topoisomerase IV [Aquiflexum sp. TKW24L]MCL6258145.1 DNA topoisomerase IV [Aquiflexum sp. TKW24L]